MVRCTNQQYRVMYLHNNLTHQIEIIAGILQRPLRQFYQQILHLFNLCHFQGGFFISPKPWKIIPEDVGHITEHNKTCLTLKLFFIFLRRAFYWSSANMVGRHFWKIDIFFLRDSLVNMMTWLYYTYNNIEFQTLKIFLSSSYEMWREFPWGHLGIFTLRQFLLS